MVKILAQLFGHQAQQLEADRTASQQVGVPPAHLAGTGAAKGENRLPFLDQVVDFIQQHGRFLNFVHHHQSVCRQGSDLFAEQRRLLEIAHQLIGLEQVDAPGVRIARLEQGGLAGLARRPEEIARLRDLGEIE